MRLHPFTAVQQLPRALLLRFQAQVGFIDSGSPLHTFFWHTTAKSFLCSFGATGASSLADACLDIFATCLVQDPNLRRTNISTMVNLCTISGSCLKLCTGFSGGPRYLCHHVTCRCFKVNNEEDISSREPITRTGSDDDAKFPDGLCIKHRHLASRGA